MELENTGQLRKGPKVKSCGCLTGWGTKNWHTSAFTVHLSRKNTSDRKAFFQWTHLIKSFWEGNTFLPVTHWSNQSLRLPNHSTQENSGNISPTSTYHPTTPPTPPLPLLSLPLILFVFQCSANFALGCNFDSWENSPRLHNLVSRATVVLQQ